MHYIPLGDTALRVSRLCLGCMTFGEPDRGRHAWTLPEESSRPLIQHAIEGGINFFDTANSYSDGSSEEIVGRALRDFARRDEVVKAGKARYIGASSMHARQFAQALALQQQNGWARFVTMQDHYNLIYREEENEMLPLCQRNGVAVIPWSPLARGRLTRPWGETTARLVSDEFGKSLYSASEENDAQIAGNLADVAEELDASRAQVALAWLLSKPGVAAPIIGPSRQEQLDDLLQAVDLTLSPEQIDKLEAPYQPHPVVGFK